MIKMAIGVLVGSAVMALAQYDEAQIRTYQTSWGDMYLCVVGDGCFRNGRRISGGPGPHVTNPCEVR